MDTSLIGSQITKFRKTAGMTQEELGKAVGVSTQAVSRWECGGSPDIALLPAIADTLGVDINALFGREGGEAVDILGTVGRWARTLPEEQSFDQLNRLLWSAVTQLISRTVQWSELPYLKSCREAESGNANSGDILASQVATDRGIFFGVAAEDLNFSMLCPRPEAGYDAYFPDCDKARILFDLLAQPECLELLIHMMKKEERFYSVDVLARGMGKEPEVLTALLDRLIHTGLVDYTEVEMLAGLEKVYIIGNGGLLVPLLYLSSILTQQRLMYYVNYQNHTKPLI